MTTELVITNLTLSNIVINSEIGSIGARKTVSLSKTRDEVDRSLRDLDRLSASGVIRWETNDTSSSTVNGVFNACSHRWFASSGTIVSQVSFVDSRYEPLFLTLPPTGSLPVTELLVVDVMGNASTNNITVLASVGQSIRGFSSLTISSNFGYVRLVFDGSNWSIVGGEVLLS